MLTNFTTVKKSIERLKKIETMKADGTYNVLTKKEVSQLEKEREKARKEPQRHQGNEEHPVCCLHHRSP